jgi:hypothetical protein
MPRTTRNAAAMACRRDHPSIAIQKISAQQKAMPISPFATFDIFFKIIIR